MQREHKITLQFKMIQIADEVYLELHTFISQERILKSFVANDPVVCCCMLLLLLNATSFENGCSTAKELIYSV